MKRMLFTVIALSIMLVLSGCGGSSPPPPIFETTIVSDPLVDGDIELDLSNVYTIRQNTQSVFAGIDRLTGSETRALLDFPLTGTGGVPGNAFIDSARLKIFIDSFDSAASSIPIRVELVELAAFPLQDLLIADYGSTPLTATTITFQIFPTDVDTFVSVDVTPLMVKAQGMGLPNFQIRLLEEFGPVFSGLIEIDESAEALAPSLKVFYFF